MLTDPLPALPGSTALHAHTMREDDEHHWSRTLMSQPFYVDGLSYDDYAPAFRLGHAHYREDTLFDDVVRRLGSEWEDVKGGSRLAWLEAQHAARAAWDRSAAKGDHATSEVTRNHPSLWSDRGFSATQGDHR